MDVKTNTVWLKEILNAQFACISSTEDKEELLGEYYNILVEIQYDIMKEIKDKRDNELRLCKLCKEKSFRKDYKEYHDRISGYTTYICPKCGVDLMDYQYIDLESE